MEGGEGEEERPEPTARLVHGVRLVQPPDAAVGQDARGLTTLTMQRNALVLTIGQATVLGPIGPVREA